MDRGFRIHDHTADITIECWAPTLTGAFEEAARATFETILDISTVRPLTPTEVVVRGTDLEELLVEWIGRLIALIDIDQQFFSKFEVNDISEEPDEYALRARAWGENINLARHVTKTEVKAMTYADLSIQKKPKKTTIWFTLDL